MLLAFVISLICNLWPILSCFRQTSCSQNCLQPFSYSTVANTARGRLRHNEKKGRFNPKITLSLDPLSIEGRWAVGSSSLAQQPLWMPWHRQGRHGAISQCFSPKTQGIPFLCCSKGLGEAGGAGAAHVAAAMPPQPCQPSATAIKSLELLFTTENKRRRPGAYSVLISKPKSKLIPQNQGI